MFYSLVLLNIIGCIRGNAKDRGTYMPPVLLFNLLDTIESYWICYTIALMIVLNNIPIMVKMSHKNIMRFFYCISVSGARI